MRTSISDRDSRGPGCPASAAGFTLLELLVVMAVLSLAVAVALPYLPKRGEAATVQSSARAVAGALREARGLAIQRNEPTTFALDVRARRWTIGAGRSGTLPGDLALAIETGQTLVRSADVAAIRFHADGSSTGGRIEMTMAGSRALVTIDWLTGRVAIHE